MTDASRALPVFALCLAVTASISPTTSFAADDPMRLGDAVVPIAQQITLQLDPDRDDYRGSTTIELRVAEPVDRFRLHARAMEIGAARLQRSGNEIAGIEYAAAEGDLVEFVASRTLEPGAYTLRLEFSNDFDRRALSLYKLTYEGENYLATQFQAVDARGAFPCFDEPRFKIPWQVTITAPSAEVVLSNTPVQSENEEAGRRTTVFETTPPLPSYLVAMVVGPWELVDVPGLDVPTRIVTPKGKARLGAFAVECTPKLLRALEDYFDLPYPYAKLDLVAVPEFQYGAMENVGLVTFRETLLLIDPDAATVAQMRSLASVNAHELAHMWYGNLVTMQWWDDLWLNESFATWMGNKITDQVYPEFGLAITNVQGAAFAKSIDSRASSTAMREPVSAAAVEGSLDPGIAYQKGEAVLGMFEQYLGEEVFREGVRTYVRRHAGGSTVASDLLTALGEASGMDVGAAMSTFLDQPGVPEVQVTVLGDGRLELRQRRFSTLGWQPTGDERWQVPVVLRYGIGDQVHTHHVLLTDRSQIVELGAGKTPQWVHPNADERGYYRWDLEPGKFLDLVERASTTLQPRERVALVGQISAQLDAGRLSGGDYLRACGLLAEDPHAAVLNASLTALMRVRAAFLVAEDRGAFASWIRSVCRPALERFGLTPREGEDEAVTLVRPSLITWLGGWGEDEEVRAFAREAAERYLADRGSVDPSIAGPCLGVAAADGDWKLYNAYVKAFESATVPAERQRFLGAIGEFTRPGMQEAALDYALRGPLRPQELFAIPQSVAMNSLDAPDRMWNWFTSHHDAIAAKIPPAFRAYLPLFGSGCEAERLEAVEAFFATEERRAPGIERQLERLAESTLECAGLRAREGSSVRAFLAARDDREE